MFKKKTKYVYIAIENEYAFGNKVNNILGVFKTYEGAKNRFMEQINYFTTNVESLYEVENHNDIYWLMYRREDWEDESRSKYDRIFKRYYVIKQEVLD